MAGGEDLRALAIRIAAAGGKRILLTEPTARRIARALMVYVDLLSTDREALVWAVEVWGSQGDLAEVLARSGNASVAIAAYEQALIERPASHVTLKQGVRVVRQRAATPPKPQASPPA